MTARERAKRMFVVGPPDAAPGPITTPDYTRIPASLTELDQWVLWREENKTKRPYSVKTQKLASPTARNHWCSFESALSYFSKHPPKFSGLGFVFSPDDNLAGIDLDECLTADGTPKPWAQQILAGIHSYSEISPSGHGIKIFTLAKLSDAGVKRYLSATGQVTSERPDDCDGAIEIYDRGRYFTVTGNVFAGPANIDNCQREVSQLYEFLRNSNNAVAHPARVTLPDQISAGNRHPYLLKLAASLWAQNLSDEAIRATLRIENQARCKPPKPDTELDGIIAWFQAKPKGKTVHIPREMLSEVIDVTATETGPVAIERVPYIVPTDEHQQTPPNDLARVLLRDHLLLVYRNLLYEYNGRRWERIMEGVLSQYALSLDSHGYTKQARRSEVVSFVTAAARNDRIVWRQLADHEVPVWNGVVDIQTCAIRPHRPEDYLESVVPHDYDPREHPHVWLATLDRWFRGDPDKEAKTDALQEFFGYCLLPHARFKKALFLYGESDTGKSQIPLILKALVGQENICTLNTEQMADERKRAQIVGKMVNLMTELPTDALIEDGGFKQLVSTGDPISIDPKYVEPFSYTPYCKHAICTNNLPEIRDQTQATYNRLLFVKFNNVIPRSEQDDMLIDKLVSEVRGILAWAVEGAARLVQNRGKFTEITESSTSVRAYRESQNPVYEFVEELCQRQGPREDSEAQWGIPSTEFRDQFSTWIKKQISPRNMCRMLESAGFEVKQKKYPSGRVLRSVMGLEWVSRLGL